MQGFLNSRNQPNHEKRAEGPRPGARAEGLPTMFRAKGNASSAGSSLLFRPTSRYPTLNKDPTPPIENNVAKRFDVTRGVSPNQKKAVKRTLVNPAQAAGSGEALKSNEEEPKVSSKGKTRVTDPEVTAIPQVQVNNRVAFQNSETSSPSKIKTNTNLETARQDVPMKIIRPAPKIVKPRFNPQDSQEPKTKEKFMPPPRVNSISRPTRRVSYIPYGGFDSFLDNYYDDDQTISRDDILEENEISEGHSEPDEDSNLDAASYTPSNASSDAEPNVQSFAELSQFRSLPNEASKSHEPGLSDEKPESSSKLMKSQNLHNKNKKAPFPQPRYPSTQSTMVPFTSEPIRSMPPSLSNEQQDVSRRGPVRLKQNPSPIKSSAPNTSSSEIRNNPPSPVPTARAESVPVGNSRMTSQGPLNRIGVNDNNSNPTVNTKEMEDIFSGMSINNSSSPAVLEMDSSEVDNDAIPCHPDDKLLIPPPKNVSHADVMVAEQNFRKARVANPIEEVELAKLYLDALETLENKSSSVPDPATYNTRMSVYRRRAIEILKKHAFPNKTQDSVAEALFLIGQFYSQGVLGFPRDAQKAFELYGLSSKKGHSLGTYRAAVCLQTGIGVRPDARKSVLLYKKAAEMDIVEAMFRMGLIYLNGLLNQKIDVPLGLQYLERACETRRPEAVRAMYELAKIYEQTKRFNVSVSSERKFELYKLSASYGLAAAQCKLGECFEHGLLDCVPEPRRSIFWYTRAAEQDYGEAELGLSGWYLTGAEDILPKNNEEALLWAHKAAVKGLAQAQFAVGFMMEHGIGITADPAAAHNWYIRAAKQGFVKAQKRLEEQSLSTKKSQPKKSSKKQDEQCIVM
ncbi:chitin synthase regulatory factor Chr3 [Schizosaccharomyces octosporus yFS286]|uniref:Chitin synthase regulatory factor Chr3 n=1 Tax=Schizosaccharomyces octosporus (strain yFS286) TaxID=483514 RepID=S9PXN5_SCHOY|nr:chitin synthase regulatory factor Chr3 [Schizosaccharomyces octosporus yFS286]EPX72742.1 chitin synthase regulatory factor Chr3 [Schizosaccharomyces octosporus yFS286]